VSKPIAILHVLYRAIGEQVYRVDSHYELEGFMWACRTTDTDQHRPPFYIEWLDQHNPREVTNESEAGDE